MQKMYARVPALAVLLVLVALLTTTVLASGCAKAPPNLSPAANQAFVSLQVQRALDTIRDIAQDGHAATPPVFTEATTRAVTNWHTAAITVVHASAAGWPAAVVASLDQLLVVLPPGERTTLTPYVLLAKTVLGQVLR